MMFDTKLRNLFCRLDNVRQGNLCTVFFIIMMHCQCCKTSTISRFEVNSQYHVYCELTYIIKIYLANISNRFHTNIQTNL